MKKILLLGTFIFSITTFAQLRQGRSLIGGSISYSGSKETQTAPYSDGPQIQKIHDLQLELRYGYLLSDKWMLGALGTYENYLATVSFISKTDPSAFIQKTDFKGYTAGLFTRRYTMLGRHIALFLELSAQYGKATENQSISNTNSSGITSRSSGRNDYTLNMIAFNPGIAYFINDRFALEASFGNINYKYQILQYYKDGYIPFGRSTYSQINASLSFSTLYFGINFYIGRPIKATKQTEE